MLSAGLYSMTREPQAVTGQLETAATLSSRCCNVFGMTVPLGILMCPSGLLGRKVTTLGIVLFPFFTISRGGCDLTFAPTL